MNIIERYIIENDIIKALNLPEPKIGRDYPSEKVKRYLKIIDAALEAMKNKEENDYNDAVVEDLRDKRKKWKNVDKETEPVKTKTEVPPEDVQEPEQPKEKPQEQPEPQKQEDIIIKHIAMLLGY